MCQGGVMKQTSITQAAMLAGLCLYLPGVQGFLPGRQTCTMRQRSGEVMMRSGYDDARTDRRASVAQTLAGVLGVVALGQLSSPLPSVAKPIEDPTKTFEESIATLMNCKKVLIPVKRYIEIGQYDPARTNIKYCMNQLRMKKAMDKAVQLGLDRVEDYGKLEEAAEATAVMDNNLVQLDSSVYTNIFIPTEGEITPTANKYRQQAFDFYDTVMSGIDKVLALATDTETKAAEQLTAKVELPDFLFKTFTGDFYRPATP